MSNRTFRDPTRRRRRDDDAPPQAAQRPLAELIGPDAAALAEKLPHVCEWLERMLARGTSAAVNDGVEST
jgi:hypothetical protein